MRRAEARQWRPAPIAVLAALGLALAFAATVAAQVGYPARQDAAINDFAGVLSASDRAEINSARQALLEQRGAELVVATIGAVAEYDQSDRSFEAFATGLFNSWGVGDRQRNDGVLLLVAVNDRRVRIEVGSGYGSQHNAAMQQVIDQAILPQMRAGNYGAGVAAGAAGIADVLLGAPAASPGGLRALLSTPIGLLGGGVALVGIAGTAYAFWRELRAPKRRCARCGRGMRQLSPQAGQAQLKPGQRLEHDLGSASYVVWQCRGCQRYEPARTLRFSSPLEECPSCSYRTLQISAQPIAGKTSKRNKRQQLQRIERACQNCRYTDHRTETIARAASVAYAASNSSYDSSSSSSYDSSSSSYDSSSSSSYDSGGSSSGDGASGSW